MCLDEGWLGWDGKEGARVGLGMEQGTRTIEQGKGGRQGQYIHRNGGRAANLEMRIVMEENNHIEQEEEDMAIMVDNDQLEREIKSKYFAMYLF